MDINVLLEKEALSATEGAFLLRSKLTPFQKKKFEAKLIVQIENHIKKLNDIRSHARKLYEEGFR